MASWLSKLVPNVEPVTPMFVDALASNLELDVANNNVTEPVQPTEAFSSWDTDIRELDAEISTMNKITVTRNSACYFFTEIGLSIDGI